MLRVLKEILGTLVLSAIIVVTSVAFAAAQKIEVHKAPGRIGDHLHYGHRAGVAFGRCLRAQPIDRSYMVLDVAVWAALLVAVWSRLHAVLSSRWWWTTLAAAAVFAPALTTVFWLQFNLVVLAMALGGFSLIGRRDRTAGLLIGLSMGVKPIAILLPLALLLHRSSRRAAVWSIATAAVLTGLGLAFLAWRAGDPRVLNPMAYLSGFVSKGQGPLAGCLAVNISPAGLLCRLGVPTSDWVTVAVAAGVLAAGWLLLRDLPDSPAAAWEVFAGACLLSPLLSPWASPIYGVLEAPMFLLLVYQFSRSGAPRRLWLGLALAFLMAELVWDPLESLAGAPIPVLVFSYTLGQFSQYVLLLVWIRWRQLRRAPQPPAKSRAVTPSSLSDAKSGLGS